LTVFSFRQKLAYQRKHRGICKMKENHRDHENKNPAVFQQAGEGCQLRRFGFVRFTGGFRGSGGFIIDIAVPDRPRRENRTDGKEGGSIENPLLAERGTDCSGG